MILRHKIYSATIRPPSYDSNLSSTTLKKLQLINGKKKNTPLYYIPNRPVTRNEKYADCPNRVRKNLKILSYPPNLAFGDVNSTLKNRRQEQIVTAQRRFAPSV